MLLIPVGDSSSAFKFLRVQQGLLGIKNGANTSFAAPDYFLKSSEVTIEVFWNGRALAEGVDFLASEPGGPGTGYKAITLLWSKNLPAAGDSLNANYLIGPGG